MTIDDAKVYAAMLAELPDFARRGEAISQTLYELCKLSDTEAAYALGEQVRSLVIQWVGLAASTGFKAGKENKP